MDQIARLRSGNMGCRLQRDLTGMTRSGPSIPALDYRGRAEAEIVPPHARRWQYLPLVLAIGGAVSAAAWCWAMAAGRSEVTAITGFFLALPLSCTSLALASNVARTAGCTWPLFIAYLLGAIVFLGTVVFACNILFF